MAIVFRFTTSAIDLANEPVNEINPIPGASLLGWLAARARPRLAIPPADAEDWGWYSDVTWDGRAYLLGASGSEPEADGSREWVVQVEKHRSLKERLLGRERMAADDLCAAFVLGLLRSEPRLGAVDVEN